MRAQFGRTRLAAALIVAAAVALGGLYFHFTDSQAAATDEITMSSTAAGASVPSGGQFTIDFAVTTSTHNYNGIQWEIAYAANRSEEHTSELQSRGHLVCRLLLEKK